MPAHSGDAFLVRAAGTDVNGKGRTDDALAAYSAGANDFVAKPIDSAELRARVRTLLLMKHSANERFRMEMAFCRRKSSPILFSIR